MWYATSMLQCPCCTSCQSRAPGDLRRRGRCCRRACRRGRPSTPHRLLGAECIEPVDELLGDLAGRRAHRRPARRRSCARISLTPRTFAVRPMRGTSHAARDRPASPTRRRAGARARPRSAVCSTERRGQGVAEHTAGLDHVLGDHDAVLGLGIHAGPHALERAHAGVVGEIPVEARLGHARLRAHRPGLGEVPLRTQGRREPGRDLGARPRSGTGRSSTHARRSGPGMTVRRPGPPGTATKRGGEPGRRQQLVRSSSGMATVGAHACRRVVAGGGCPPRRARCGRSPRGGRPPRRVGLGVGERVVVEDRHHQLGDEPRVALRIGRHQEALGDAAARAGATRGR